MKLLNTAKTVLSTLELLPSALDLGEKKLKDAKAVCQALADEAPKEYKARLETMAKVRGRKGLEQLIGTFGEYVASLEEAQVGGDAIQQLVTIKSELDQLLADRLSNSIALGRVLTKAQNQFTKGADFIKWVESACGIKKAQAYKWIKVYNTFGESERFQGIAMRVLYDLASLGIDSVEFEQACELLDNGQVLDTNALKAIREANKPVPSKELNLVEDDVTSTESVTVEESQEEQELDNSDAPFETDTDQEVNDLFQPIGAESVPEAAPSDSKDELIKALQEQIKALTDELRQASQPQPAPQAMATLPALPQFDSIDAYCVLGLSEKLAPTDAEIKKAFRTLAKLYSNQPEVSAKLKAARDTLLG